MTSLVTKAAELGAVGTLTGVAMSGLAQVCLLLIIATSDSRRQTEKFCPASPLGVHADEADNLHRVWTGSAGAVQTQQLGVLC